MWPDAQPACSPTGWRHLNLHGSLVSSFYGRLEASITDDGSRCSSGSASLRRRSRSRSPTSYQLCKSRIVPCRRCRCPRMAMGYRSSSSLAQTRSGCSASGRPLRPDRVHRLSALQAPVGGEKVAFHGPQPTVHAHPYTDRVAEGLVLRPCGSRRGTRGPQTWASAC
jgi:hypothetical protein